MATRMELLDPAHREDNNMHKAATLRQLVNSNKINVAPGVFDGLSALLAKQAGFTLLYASGGAIARSMGYPDLGLTTLTEVLLVLSRIVATSQLPVIADADTGFGNTLNVIRTVKEYESVGVAALHFEDQSFPKRCGHLNDKSLIPTREMCAKIIAAITARSNPDFLIIARTDAIAAEGFASAIQRANAYIQAGADMVFIEAPESVEQIKEIAKKISAPKLINMFSGGKTPLVSVDELQSLGYNIVIIPSDLQRASIKAMQTTLSTIAKDGNSAAIEAQLTTFKDRENIIGTDKYLATDLEANKHAEKLPI